MAAAQCSIDAAVAMDVLRLFCYIFAHNSHFDLEPDDIIGKGIDTEFNDIQCVREYCQFFTHELIIDQYVSVSVCRHCKVGLLDENAEQCQKPRQKQPLNPIRHVDFHLTHECLGPPHSPPQTASGSNQPFCHNSHVRTDTGGRLFNHISAMISYFDSERRAIKAHTPLLRFVVCFCFCFFVFVFFYLTKLIIEVTDCARASKRFKHLALSRDNRNMLTLQSTLLLYHKTAS